MLKKYFLTMLVALSTLLATANAEEQVRPRSKTDANITGHVIDKSTGEHIPFVTIGVSGASIGAISDDTGHYKLSNLPEGETELTAKFAGYDPQTLNIKVEKGNTYVLHFELQPTTVTADQVVVTANRYATKKREAATIVNVVSPKLFENTASVTPAEALDFQPGLRVEYNCGNCGVPQLRINGLEGQYSQVLLDSRPIFSSLGMVYGLEQLPASMIERVEVIRGGGSTLFGSNAIGGIVNIITKEPTRSSFQASNQSMLMGGSATDIVTSLNGSVVSEDLRSGLYLFGMIRDRAAYDRNDDGFSEIPELKSETLGFRGYQKIGKNSKLTAEYHHINERRRGGDRLDLEPHEAFVAEQLRHRIDGGSIQWDWTKGNNAINVYSATQYIHRNSYFGTNQNLDAYGRTKDLTVNSGAQWTHRFNRLWFMPSTLTMGAEFNYNNLWDNMIGYNREIKQISNTVGFYAQNEWSNEKWTILAGARIDKNNLINKPIVSPRATVRFAPIEELSIRAGYARGFRAPQAYDEDLHVSAVGGEVSFIVLDPNLRPEFSNTYNLSLDFFKQLGNWQVNFLTEAFYTELQDVFALRQAGHDQQNNLLLERYNASGATVAGVNFELRASYLSKFNLQAGFTLQKSRYKEPLKWSENENVIPQKRMFRSPDTYGYLTLDYRPVTPFNINLSATYTGSMLVQHLAGYIPEDTQKLTPQFLDMGMKLSWDIPMNSKLKIQINGGVKNILDQYQKDLDFGADKDSKYIYGPILPRSYFVGVKLFI